MFLFDIKEIEGLRMRSNQSKVALAKDAEKSTKVQVKLLLAVLFLIILLNIYTRENAILILNENSRVACEAF